jgi:iron only hydrogenase large subunit-like protein
MKKPKKLVVLNPVIEKLLGKQYDDLIVELQNRELYVEDSKRGIQVVRIAYRDYLQQTSKKPVIDSRCPEIYKLIKYEFEHLVDYLAPIKPILITGAELAYQDFKERYKEDVTLTIVTPCKALADYDKSKLSYTTELITWRDFCKANSLEFPYEILKESPVKGFFEPLGVPVISKSGKREVKKLLEKFANLPSETQLVELLYCKGGCHKGDSL